MENKFYKLTKKQIFFKNKEIQTVTHILITKVLGTKNIMEPFKEKLLNDTKGERAPCKHFKGSSIINSKRRAFYKHFQLSRFDIKKLMSNRLITGLSSAY